MIDLHIHSTCSDGSVSPEELVQAGEAAGLYAMALTDHDTVEGVERFLGACARSCTKTGERIRGISGVEISADVDRGSLHMLGYFVDPKDGALQEALRRIREGRQLRNRTILERLQNAGIGITWEEVKGFAGEDMVGRPHFAQALLRKGYVRTIKQAFDRYLARGKRAYVERVRLSPEESIAAIRGAGGVPVLGHPATLGLDTAALKGYVRRLKEIGLLGMEVYYTEYTPTRTRQFLELAEELSLVATGGTDFHGAITPDIRLGRGFGNLDIPDEIVANLEQCRVKMGEG